jgi:hypothetical protein
MASDKVTLAEVMAHWAKESSVKLDIVSSIVPEEALNEELSFAFNNGATRHVLEIFIEGRDDLTRMQRAVFASYLDTCREWSEQKFKRPKRSIEAFVKYPSPSDLVVQHG